MTPRLARIQSANTKSRTRDLLFALAVSLTAVISVSSIGTAVDAAMQIAQR